MEQSVHTVAGHQIDESQWPIVIVRVKPDTSDAQMIEFLEFFIDFVRERRERYGVVLDLKNTKKMDSRQRRLLTKSMSKNKEFTEQYCACNAMVFDSPVIRGVLMAVFWIIKPAFPSKVFAEVEDAVKWAHSQI